MRISLANQLKISSIRLVAPARLPTAPSGPHRAVDIGKILFFELVASCVLVIIIGYMRQTINSDHDLEKVPGLVHLGYVPKINPTNSDKRYLANLVQREPQSKFAEMIRNIRVSIDFSIDRIEEKSLLITSALPEEGKSIFSTNLSLAYAQDDQKVLLVDADLRRPSLARNLGLDHDAELIHFLTGQKKFENLILDTGVKNFSVVLTKTIAPNPVEVLNSKRMSQFLHNAEERFDKIVIDSPPVVGLSDSLVLSRLAKVTFLVIRARKTPVGSLRQSILGLKHASAKVMGAIINQIDGSTERYYYGSYRYSYSKYLNKKKK